MKESHEHDENAYTNHTTKKLYVIGVASPDETR